MGQTHKLSTTFLVVTYYLEVALQLYTTALLFPHDHHHGWFPVLLGIVCVPLILTNVISIVWVYHNMDFAERRCGEVTCNFFHLVLLGPLWRWFKMFLDEDNNDYNEFVTLHLAHGVLQSVVFSTAMTTLIYSSVNFSPVFISAALMSLFGVATSAAAYMDHKSHKQSTRPFVCALILFLWKLCAIIPRIVSLATFLYVMPQWGPLVLASHWLVLFIWKKVERAYVRRKCRCANCDVHWRDVMMSFLNIFDWIAVDSHIVKIIAYYVLMLFENALLLVSWLHLNPEQWLSLPTICASAGCFVLSFTFMGLYYRILQTTVDEFKSESKCSSSPGSLKGIRAVDVHHPAAVAYRHARRPPIVRKKKKKKKKLPSLGPSDVIHENIPFRAPNPQFSNPEYLFSPIFNAISPSNSDNSTSSSNTESTANTVIEVNVHREMNDKAEAVMPKCAGNENKRDDNEKRSSGIEIWKIITKNLDSLIPGRKDSVDSSAVFDLDDNVDQPQPCIPKLQNIVKGNGSPKITTVSEMVQQKTRSTKGNNEIPLRPLMETTAEVHRNGNPKTEVMETECIERMSVNLPPKCEDGTMVKNTQFKSDANVPVQHSEFITKEEAVMVNIPLQVFNENFNARPKTGMMKHVRKHPPRSRSCSASEPVPTHDGDHSSKPRIPLREKKTKTRQGSMQGRSSSTSDIGSTGQVFSKQPKRKSDTDAITALFGELPNSMSNVELGELGDLPYELNGEGNGDDEETEAAYARIVTHVNTSYPSKFDSSSESSCNESPGPSRENSIKLQTKNTVNDTLTKVTVALANKKMKESNVDSPMNLNTCNDVSPSKYLARSRLNSDSSIENDLSRHNNSAEEKKHLHARSFEKDKPTASGVRKMLRFTPRKDSGQSPRSTSKEKRGHKRKVFKFKSSTKKSLAFSAKDIQSPSSQGDDTVMSLSENQKADDLANARCNDLLDEIQVLVPPHKNSKNSPPSSGLVIMSKDTSLSEVENMITTKTNSERIPNNTKCMKNGEAKVIADNAANIRSANVKSTSELNGSCFTNDSAETVIEVPGPKTVARIREAGKQLTAHLSAFTKEMTRPEARNDLLHHNKFISDKKGPHISGELDSMDLIHSCGLPKSVHQTKDAVVVKNAENVSVPSVLPQKALTGKRHAISASQITENVQRKPLHSRKTLSSSECQQQKNGSNLATMAKDGIGSSGVSMATSDTDDSAGTGMTRKNLVKSQKKIEKIHQKAHSVVEDIIASYRIETEDGSASLISGVEPLTKHRSSMAKCRHFKRSVADRRACRLAKTKRTADPMRSSMVNLENDPGSTALESYDSLDEFDSKSDTGSDVSHVTWPPGDLQRPRMIDMESVPRLNGVDNVADWMDRNFEGLQTTRSHQKEKEESWC